MVINYTCVFAAAALKKKTKVCNKADVAESWSLGGSECETRRSGDYWLSNSSWKEAGVRIVLTLESPRLMDNLDKNAAAAQQQSSRPAAESKQNWNLIISYGSSTQDFN